MGERAEGDAPPPAPSVTPPPAPSVTPPPAPSVMALPELLLVDREAGEKSDGQPHHPTEGGLLTIIGVRE